jgi:hypothetical protein
MHVIRRGGALDLARPKKPLRDYLDRAGPLAAESDRREPA